MTKFERIKLVYNLGLNTENCILVTDISQLDSEMQFQLYDTFSIRTQWADGNEVRKTPHLAVVEKKDLKKESKKLLDMGLQLLIKECIDPKDCEFCGTALKKDGIITFEIAIGPVTVREVTHKNNIDFTFVCNRQCADTVNCTVTRNKCTLPHGDVTNIPAKIRLIYAAIANLHLDNVIFEFSWYSKPVGWKQENAIIWEITRSGYGNEYTMSKTGTQYKTLLWERFNKQ